jgi:hypothetical protein
MPDAEYRPHFADDVPESEREKLRGIVRAFRGVRFNANEVLARALNLDATLNAGHIAQAITDLEDRGEIRKVEGTHPPEWEWE